MPVLTTLLSRRPVLRLALLVALAVGATAALLGASASSAALFGWNAGALAHIGVLAARMAGATPEAIRARAAELDESRFAVLALSVGAALASLAAVVVDLAAARGTAEAGRAALLAGVTVVVSWAFVVVLFAQHYAHAYWLEGEGGGGLSFPGEDRPDFWEFFYVSLTVGMTAQVSDVTTTSAAMRRIVSAQGALSFVFNAVVVATAVNLAASLVG